MYEIKPDYTKAKGIPFVYLAAKSDGILTPVEGVLGNGFHPGLMNFLRISCNRVLKVQ